MAIGKRFVVAWFVAVAVALVLLALFLSIAGQWACVGVTSVFLALVVGITFLILLRKEKPLKEDAGRISAVPPGIPGLPQLSPESQMSRTVITVAARWGVGAVPDDMSHFLRAGGSPWLKFPDRAIALSLISPPARFSSLGAEASEKFIAHRIIVENSRKDGGQQPAKDCEATLYLQDGRSQRLLWPGGSVRETIELDSQRQIDVFALEAKNEFALAPTSRGYFAFGRSDYVRLDKFPTRMHLRVTCSNGDPAGMDIILSKLPTGGIMFNLRSEVPRYADNWTFAWKGKKYTS